jgi:hypothetical protein
MIPYPEPDMLARLRREHGGEYVITEFGGCLWAWRHDGTTRTIRAGTVAELAAAIRENRRTRPRLAA